MWSKAAPPLGDNGDFISLAGQLNINRNNFLGSVPLRTDLTQGFVGTGSPAAPPAYRRRLRLPCARVAAFGTAG